MQKAGEFNKLKRSNVPLDKGSHRKLMQDVIFCEDKTNRRNSLVMHSEQNSRQLQWYSLRMKSLKVMEVPCKSQNDRVLSIAHQDISESIYAFGPEGTDAVYGVLCTDHILYIYIRIKKDIQLFTQIDTGSVAQDKVWYMAQHKEWLTAGKDFKIRKWNISPIVPNKLKDNEPQQLHSDKITDCVEITSPLSVATCSLDHSIVLYDLKKKEVLRRLSQRHVTGVRHLRYLKDFGGILISTGFEIFANVWVP